MNSTYGEAAPVAPIMSVECNEKRGDVMRHVYPVALSVDNLKAMWHQFSKFRTVLGEEVDGDFWKFVSLFVDLEEGKEAKARGLYWRVDDFVGMFYVTDIDIGQDALLHYTFFDRVLKGRTELIVRMLDYIFKRYGFHRVTVEIPAFASPYTLVAAERIGFVKEGRKRHCRKFDGDYFDVHSFGMLKEEFYSRYEDMLNGR